MLRAVQAVQVMLDRQLIPREYRRQSFFGEYDLWAYVAVYDDRLCEKCWGFARQQVFRGTRLRATFPEWKIRDNNLIEANVHPHCRCELLRILDFKTYIRMLNKLEGKA